MSDVFDAKKERQKQRAKKIWCSSRRRWDKDRGLGEGLKIRCAMPRRERKSVGASIESQDRGSRYGVLSPASPRYEQRGEMGPCSVGRAGFADGAAGQSCLFWERGKDYYPPTERDGSRDRAGIRPAAGAVPVWSYQGKRRRSLWARYWAAWKARCTRGGVAGTITWTRKERPRGTRKEGIAWIYV